MGNCLSIAFSLLLVCIAVVPGLKKGAFIFGGNTYVGFMDDSGVVGTQLGAPLVFPDGTVLKAKVDSVNGTIAFTGIAVNHGIILISAINENLKK